MEFKFRTQLTQEIKSYAAHTPLVPEGTLDCSLGVNPYGYPEAAAEAIRSFDLHHLMDYPHSRVHYSALVEYWKGLADITEDEIFFSNGSICGLYCLNNIFSQAERSEVLGFIPTFTDMVESARSFGMSYRGVPARLEENCRMDASDLIAAIRPETAVVYIDRPNNPTGQTMPLADVKAILEAAKLNSSYVIVDEAYGDFIPRGESSMVLRADYENLIVIKTFSKGFGLANLRGGYIVANADVCGMLTRTSNPYIYSDLERAACAAALGCPEHPQAHAADFAAAKAAIAECSGKRLKLLETDGRVPIFTLALDEPGDLQEMLLKHGVLAVSGREFELLDERYVRIRVPTSDCADRLTAAVALVEKGE